jgi:hypothetical protein
MLLGLMLGHTCDQYHASRVTTTSYRCPPKFRRNTEDSSHCIGRLSINLKLNSAIVTLKVNRTTSGRRWHDFVGFQDQFTGKLSPIGFLVVMPILGVDSVFGFGQDLHSRMLLDPTFAGLKLTCA